jgi:catecholate siderophore receptor
MRQNNRRQKHKRKGHSSRRGWIAMGALATYAVMGAARPARAAAKAHPAAGGGAAATLPLKQFNIPSGPLEQAIAAFEKVTGLKMKNA